MKILIDERIEEIQEKFRLKFLEMLDKTTNEIFKNTKKQDGAKDKDLPFLFPYLDKHVEKLFWRHQYYLEIGE